MRTNVMMRTTLATALAAAAMFAAGPAAAGLVPGGGKSNTAAADCFAELEVTDLEAATVTVDSKGKPTVTCEDGSACDQDGTANDECVFSVTPCINQGNVEGCTPLPALKSLKAKGKVKGVKGADGKIVIDTTQLLEGSVCGAFLVDVTIPVKINKQGEKSQGTATVNLNAKAPKGTPKPNKDADKINLACTPVTIDPNCTDNAGGGPDQLKLTVGPTGNDLDNGWTGVSQNFAVTPNGDIFGCLSDCNLTDDTVCTVSGNVGPGTSNGEFFGAPLPLLAGGVPVCVVNNFNETVVGTADYATGDMTLNVTLLSDVFFTDKAEVCPRCTNNKCSSGKNIGKACTTEAMLTVAEGLGNKDYNLSRECPPEGAPVATLDIRFDPLTSGTTGDLVGPIPCPRPDGTPPGVPPQPDDCQGTCDAQCTGTACVEMVVDPVNPPNLVCRDNKGGISQVCCSDDTTRSCFPIADGGILNRQGRPGAPAPLFPDTTFPKTGTGTLASVFCEAATGTSTIDLTTGLPGPAALLLTGTQEWTQSPVE